eukprot:COSAG04_NODE_918_length_9425_cov_1.980270_3_plen_79_part_00
MAVWAVLRRMARLVTPRRMGVPQLALLSLLRLRSRRLLLLLPLRTLRLPLALIRRLLRVLAVWIRDGHEGCRWLRRYE